VGAATTNNLGGVTRATAATAASRAKAGTGGDNKADLAAQGKRKREALGEVTALVTNNRTKGTGVAGGKGLKGKDKEVSKDDVGLKSKSTVVRQPLRTVMGPATRRTTRSTTVASQPPLPEAKEEPVEVYDDNAMVVDEEPPAPAPATTRRLSARKSNSQNAPSIRHSDINRRGSTRSITQKPVEVDPESARAFKKRRTSSEAPEDEQQVLEEERVQQELRDGIDELGVYADEEPEADPEGDQWTDLDAEDADDPLMVSEYVIEIFNYMKQMEVCTRLVFSAQHWLTKVYSQGHHHAEPELHVKTERSGVENARNSERLAHSNTRQIPSPSRDTLPRD
jgi:G2/mitotic-specific cyclin 2